MCLWNMSCVSIELPLKHETDLFPPCHTTTSFLLGSVDNASFDRPLFSRVAWFHWGVRCIPNHVTSYELPQFAVWGKGMALDVFPHRIGKTSHGGAAPIYLLFTLTCFLTFLLSWLVTCFLTFFSLIYANLAFCSREPLSLIMLSL